MKNRLASVFVLALSAAPAAAQVGLADEFICPDAFLQASGDLNTGDGLGASLGHAGGVLAVGAPEERYADNTIRGRVYLYGTTGSQPRLTSLGSITPPGPGFFRFGADVAMQAERLLIGAPNGDQSSVLSYVKIEPWGYFLHEILYSPYQDNDGSGGFGEALEYVGDRLFVAAPDRNFFVNSQDVGAVYEYVRSPLGHFVLWDTIFPPDLGDTRFGEAMSYCEESGVLVVGTPGGESSSQGSAHVYRRSVSGYLEYEAGLVPVGSGSTQGTFGRAVAVEAGRAIVGGFNSNTAVATVLMEFNYNETTGAWDHTSEFGSFLPGTRVGDLVLDGDRLYVSAYSDAYRFGRSQGGAWEQITRLATEDPLLGTTQKYGALAVSDEFVALGTPSSDQCGDFNGIEGGLAVWLGPDLLSDVREVSISGATPQELILDGGPALAGRPYMLFGSADASGPGIDLGNGEVFPLEVDDYFNLVFTSPRIVFDVPIGVFDSHGIATVTYQLPAGVDPSLAGVVLSHAWVSVAPDFSLTASTAESVVLVP